MRRIFSFLFIRHKPSTREGSISGAPQRHRCQLPESARIGGYSRTGKDDSHRYGRSPAKPGDGHPAIGQIEFTGMGKNVRGFITEFCSQGDPGAIFIWSDLDLDPFETDGLIDAVIRVRSVVDTLADFQFNPAVDTPRDDSGKGILSELMSVGGSEGSGWIGVGVNLGAIRVGFNGSNGLTTLIPGIAPGDDLKALMAKSGDGDRGIVFLNCVGMPKETAGVQGIGCVRVEFHLCGRRSPNREGRF